MPAALLLAYSIVRMTFVEAFAIRDPAKAAAIWPGHPTVLLKSGLAQVGELAAAGKPVDKALVDRLVSTSAKAPLAPEPFLVRGVAAQETGDLALALQAYLAARQRNPRSIAPRYFLADLHLKAGRTGPGLAEISALVRLIPQSLPKIAPYLAAYARNPISAPQVKEMLKAHPHLEVVLLNELAAEPANAKLMFYLWSGRGGEEARPWQERLLNQLVEADRFYEARDAWARFMGISVERDRIFDPEFTARALPPFGWTFASGSSGIAEPQGGGRLHALYYGRDDLVLASQLLTLSPGNYRFSMNVNTGSPASKSLSWTVRCLPRSNLIASIPLARSGTVSHFFRVANSGCTAQRVELVGNAPEFPDRAEATISRLQLHRVTAR